MIDEKEDFINNVVLVMNLPQEDSERLKNILWMKLHEFSLTKIETTDVVVREESINEEAYRMFFVAKKYSGAYQTDIKILFIDPECIPTLYR